MMALVTRVSRPGCSARTARHEVGRHSVPFDANGGSLRRQEIARALLCNRQRSTHHPPGRLHRPQRDTQPDGGMLATLCLAKTLSAVHTVTLFVFSRS